MSIDPSDPTLSADPGEILSALPAALRLMPVHPGPASLRGAAKREGAGMTLEARRRIGRDLRLLYAEVLDLPLPDRFDALLADLATRSDTRGSS